MLTLFFYIADERQGKCCDSFVTARVSVGKTGLKADFGNSL